MMPKDLRSADRKSIIADLLKGRKAGYLAFPSLSYCARNAQRSLASFSFLMPANTILVPGIFAFGSWLRKAARRTTEAVYNAIGPILDTVSAAECANYFVNAGYDQT